MVAPQIFALSKDFTRPKSDPDGAKKLMAEAGYADGFGSDDGLPQRTATSNDADICQAVVGMLARIGVKVNLLAQPRAQYFAKVLKPGGFQTFALFVGPGRRIPWIRTMCCTTSWVATTRNNPPAAKPISAATATRKWMRSPTRFWSEADTRQTRPDDQAKHLKL